MSTSTESYLKNKEEYYFTINSDGKITTRQKPIVQSADGFVKLFLNGVVYNMNKEDILEGFTKEKEYFVKKVQGSFVIFLILGNDFYVLTDCFNSKKSYYLLGKSSIEISNDVNELTIENSELDIGGIASYLTNGTMINDLTIFENIKSFPRASINKYNKDEIESNVYNEYVFEYEESTNEDLLKEELQRLITDSILKRYTPGTNATLSLSAGYDARGILGVFGEKIKAEKLDTFSYAASQQPLRNSDAYISKQLASMYQYNHETVKSYNGDLLGLLEKNALYGKGIANICFELDALSTVEMKNKYTDVFVGDEVFGWNDAHLTSEKDVLESVNLRDSSSLKQLKKFIGKNRFQQISKALDNQLEELYTKSNQHEHLHDKKDFLYLEQRINNVLMPWREQFTSKIGYVHNPFLDEEILKFMKKVPPHLRKNKKLYRLSVSEMFPQLFNIQTATQSGHSIDWRSEVKKNKKHLLAKVKNTDSMLDEIITKENVIKMIKSHGNKYNDFRVFIGRSLNYVRRKSPFLDKVLNPIIGVRTPLVDNTILLLRVLVLRIYLEK